MKKEKSFFAKTLGATALIAGTCIGGGMLALPLETADNGFLPSLVVMLFAWIFMMLTGLLVGEATTMLPNNPHYSTLSAKFLGPIGKGLGILLYLFMGFGSLVAYSSGAASILSSFISHMGISASKPVLIILFTVLLSMMMAFGSRLVSRINEVFFIGLLISYFFIVVFGLPSINTELLDHAKWDGVSHSLPLLLAAFSYQMMIPSVSEYVNKDPHALRLSILVGTFIPLVVYAVWNLMVLGTVPAEGPTGLLQAFKDGVPATEALKNHIAVAWIGLGAEFFAFFALVTSYIGIGLGTYDFLSDLTGIKKKGKGVVGLLLLLILPTVFFAVSYPRAFIVALDASGGFGDAILSNLFPIGMVFVGRYILKLKPAYKLQGGRLLLGVLATVSVYIFLVECFKYL